MDITITIPDADFPAVIQNVALAKGWTIANDEQGRTLLAADLCTTIGNLAASGENIRKRQEELAATKTAAAKISYK